MVLENLERFATRPRRERDGLHRVGVEAHNDLFRLGDFFICASEKQRDYWLGALTAAGRVNPYTYVADPTLRRLIDVVPFGLPDVPPVHRQPVLKGVVSGIGEEASVILWGGGLWDWLDPLTAIEAMPLVLKRAPQARLYFMGTRHPNPAVPPSRMAARAIERATELGLKDRFVFFNDWVPYSQRASYLREADIGISLHGDHIETRFAVRTRLMDYFWARLPMIVTGGDTLSDLVAMHGLGRVVGPGQAAAVAQGIIEMLEKPVPPEQFAQVVAMFRWSCVAEPLLHYAISPWRDDVWATSKATVLATPLAQLPVKALAALRERGLAGLTRDVRAYITWVTRRG
jgi:glycosyltransferase involved in cell wall biosynthesis